MISDGGGAPNVVPAEAAVWYYVRDLEREGVEATYARVLKCAEGAAIATETTFDVELTTGVHSYLLNRTLTELLDRNLRAAAAPEWTTAEQDFAKKLQAATGKPELGLHVGIKDLPAEPVPAQGGSTDAAEVSRLTPTGKLRVACAPIDTPWHAWPVVACAGTTIGHKCVRTASRALGSGLVELLVSPGRAAGLAGAGRGGTQGVRHPDRRQTVRLPHPAGPTATARSLTGRPRAKNGYVAAYVNDTE